MPSSEKLSICAPGSPSRISAYDNDVYQRVAVYVRVSTDDPRQTTSYELQKKYYEEFVIEQPKWELVRIYADKGISGTILKHRDEFLRMIEDAKAGKIDLIITKNVSCFARNVKDFLEMIRILLEHRPAIHFMSLRSWSAFSYCLVFFHTTLHQKKGILASVDLLSC